jgi:transposase
MPSGVSTQAGADHDRRLQGATAAMAMLAEQVDPVIGVDTHTDSHTACLVDHLGGQLAVVTVDADPDGYTTLLAWALERSSGPRLVWAVEGCRSHGAGLLRALQQAGHLVVAGRPRRASRRPGGKLGATPFAG